MAWKRSTSLKFFNTFAPLILPAEKLVLSHRQSFVSAAAGTALIDSCHFTIGRIENPSCSACGHATQKLLISFYSAAFWTLGLFLFSDSLCTISDLGYGEKVPAFLLFHHAFILRKGLGNNNN